MTLQTFYQVAWLFFSYSALGWLIEVLYGAIRNRRYGDRGILNGPLCIVYGFGALVMVGAMRELASNWFFLFLGSMIYATVIEWIAGHMLERITHTRWWDYSERHFNLDGYICLSASLCWGALGVVIVKWGTPLLLRLFALFPSLLRGILIWVMLALFCIDALGTALALTGLRYKLPRVDAVGNRLAEVTLRIGMWILEHVEANITRANPQAILQRIRAEDQKAERIGVFAVGCSFYKIALLFVIGSFLGDIVETIFCRVVGGEWMSRSSLVWGPFSIVWGLAIAAVTQLLYKYKDRPASWFFVVGTLLGGAYEYLCSVFTEIVFGAVFWDYSALPFNLGGRINLLYCFFWGFAAVAWFKAALPAVERLIERIPPRPGRTVTWCLVVFMAVDMLVSSAALMRYNDRLEGKPATGVITAFLDAHFDDARMAIVYPKAVHKDSAANLSSLIDSAAATVAATAESAVQN